MPLSIKRNRSCECSSYFVAMVGHDMSQHMRLWYLSPRRPAKAQASLCICAVSSEPSLFAHMKYGSRRRVQIKIRHLALWMAALAHLKSEFTENEKDHNRELAQL